VKKPSPAYIRENYPIVKIRFFQSGLEVVRQSGNGKKRPRGRRNYITHLSQSSLHRLAFSARNSRIAFESMLTLTCGLIYPRDGIIFKGCLNRILSSMRYRWPKIQYLWFLEFQTRGAPHIHLLLNIPVGEEKDKKWVAERWSKAVLSGACKLRGYDAEELLLAEGKMRRQHQRKGVWEKIRDQNGVAKYVTKYATKTEQKTVPKAFARVGSFWGMSKGAKPKHLFTNLTTEEELRIHLENKQHPVAEYGVLPKLIWYYEEKAN